MIGRGTWVQQISIINIYSVVVVAVLDIPILVSSARLGSIKTFWSCASLFKIYHLRNRMLKTYLTSVETIEASKRILLTFSVDQVTIRIPTTLIAGTLNGR